MLQFNVCIKCSNWLLSVFPAEQRGEEAKCIGFSVEREYINLKSTETEGIIKDSAAFQHKPNSRVQKDRNRKAACAHSVPYLPDNVRIKTERGVGVLQLQSGYIQHLDKATKTVKQNSWTLHVTGGYGTAGERGWCSKVTRPSYFLSHCLTLPFDMSKPSGNCVCFPIAN